MFFPHPRPVFPFSPNLARWVIPDGLRMLLAVQLAAAGVDGLVYLRVFLGMAVHVVVIIDLIVVAFDAAASIGDNLAVAVRVEMLHGARRELVFVERRSKFGRAFNPSNPPSWSGRRDSNPHGRCPRRPERRASAFPPRPGLARPRGIEPRSAVLQTAALPLGYGRVV